MDEPRIQAIPLTGRALKIHHSPFAHGLDTSARTMFQ